MIRYDLQRQRMKDAYLIHVELGENLSYGVCYSVQLDYNIIKMNHELKMR